MGKSLGWLVPVVLGVVAGGIYLTAIRAGTRPIELVAVAQNTLPGTDITEDKLIRISVRADKSLLRSAIRWEDRGLLLGRRVNRSLVEGELLLFTDVRQSIGDVTAGLYAGEASRTVSLPQNRIVPGLRVGDSVVFLVVGDALEAEPDPPEPKDTAKGDARNRRPPQDRELGPFRVVGLSERFESASRDEPRQVVVAVRKEGSGTPAERALRDDLDAALAGARGRRIVGVEVPAKEGAGPAPDPRKK